MPQNSFARVFALIYSERKIFWSINLSIEHSAFIYRYDLLTTLLKNKNHSTSFILITHCFSMEDNIKKYIRLAN